MHHFDIHKNSVHWDGESRGFFEAFYVQVNDPVSGMGWWFRYSMLNPREGCGRPYSALMAVQYDPSGVPVPIAMKGIYDISHFRSEKERFILYVEEAFLTNSHATGKIRHGSCSLEWDIQWVPIGSNFTHYPELWYKLPFPRSKVVSPHWATTGGGFIRWNDSEFFLKDALIHVGHVWGRAHSRKWAWVHSHGFEENPTIVFEGICAPLIGRFGLSIGFLNIDGKLTRFQKAGFVWELESFLEKGEWPIRMENSDYRVGGAINVDPYQVAGITYHDPDGGRRFCYNTKIATIRMEIIDKKTGEKTALTAPRTAGFEVSLSDELKKYPILL